MTRRPCPVVIVQTGASDGPGTFASFLTARAVPYRVVRIDRGDPVPLDARDFLGIGVMGGAMSVNDPLPWIPPLLSLIGDAIARGVPVIGHCLGGQLIARAMGARVTASPVPEIGWGEIRVDDCDEARTWFGTRRNFTAIQWHREAFAIPEGAVRVATGRWCHHQAFAVADRHLAMQFHIEMTAPAIRQWCAEGGGEIAASDGSPAVQGVAAIEAGIPCHLRRMQGLARAVYERWLARVG